MKTNVFCVSGEEWGRRSEEWGRYDELTGEYSSPKKLTMAKTTDVASDRAYDDSKTVLPAEFARGVYIQHVPSAQALKLMHLMIAAAGGAHGG